jgi:hypothetical protein
LTQLPAADDVCMEGGLHIQATAEAEARSIADALGEYGPTMEAGDGESWLVTLSDGGPDYTTLLGALQGPR